jgi:dodecin
MAIVKVIEVLAQSNQGWEAAANSALQEASRTVRGIRSIYCDDLQAKVENDRISEYRLRAKISFLVED